MRIGVKIISTVPPPTMQITAHLENKRIDVEGKMEERQEKDRKKIGDG